MHNAQIAPPLRLLALLCSEVCGVGHGNAELRTKKPFRATAVRFAASPPCQCRLGYRELHRTAITQRVIRPNLWHNHANWKDRRWEPGRRGKLILLCEGPREAFSSPLPGPLSIWPFIVGVIALTSPLVLVRPSDLNRSARLFSPRSVDCPPSASDCFDTCAQRAAALASARAFMERLPSSPPARLRWRRTIPSSASPLRAGGK